MTPVLERSTKESGLFEPVSRLEGNFVNEARIGSEYDEIVQRRYNREKTRWKK